jgi:hypothetical protein
VAKDMFVKKKVEIKDGERKRIRLRQIYFYFFLFFLIFFVVLYASILTAVENCGHLYTRVTNDAGFFFFFFFLSNSKADNRFLYKFTCLKQEKKKKTFSLWAS